VVIGRDREAIARRFGIDSGPAGAIYTRTGRPFFTENAAESAVLDKARQAIGAAGLWQELDTGWLVLDCELLPWSAKAGELIRRQYAAVGAAAGKAAASELAVLEAVAARGIDIAGLLAAARERTQLVAGFTAAYRRYCWPVESVDDLKLAPFQILAGEGAVHARRDHRWHLEIISRLASADPVLFRPTRAVTVELADPVSVQAAVTWWEEITAAGGEGMVVKPAQVIQRGRRGLAQPGIKCRGREYLRIIYGPEYTARPNLDRLRSRGLGHKRSLALREFTLGIEALERFVAAEPLYRVHECVFGVLALESEPVDPRL
jgi:protein phosphatase